jgi:hypothetical protein
MNKGVMIAIMGRGVTTEITVQGIPGGNTGQGLTMTTNKGKTNWT